ncbi:hypothetical protein Trydic_g8788 [Trypoxylus dichotomus]
MMDIVIGVSVWSRRALTDPIGSKFGAPVRYPDPFETVFSVCFVSQRSKLQREDHQLGLNRTELVLFSVGWCSYGNLKVSCVSSEVNFEF